MFSAPDNTTVDGSSNLQTVVNAVIGCVVFILCSLTITAILIAKSLKNKEKVCYLAIICTDLVIGCQILLVRLLPISYTSEHPLCHFQLWNGMVLGLATMFANMMVTTERFVSVILPFRFSEKVTCKHLIIVYLFLWVAAITLTFALFSEGFSGGRSCQFLTVGNRQSYAIYGMLMCIIVIVDFSLYACIIKVARRHIRQIAATMVVGNSTGTERVSYIKKREFRTTLNVGMITLAFGISYFPMGLHLTYYSIFSPFTTQSRTFTVMVTLFMLNSLVNPIIYIWRLKSCRQEMVNRILCRPNDVTGNSG